MRTETIANRRFVIIHGRNKDFIALCQELDGFLNALVGGEENREEYIPYNRPDDSYDGIVVYIDEIPVGCASFKKFDETTAEVKRVFIKAEYRGLGISKELMKRLEALAKAAGYSRFILESGEPLVSAMKLYRKIGYQVIPNYSPYVDKTESICMEKHLSAIVLQKADSLDQVASIASETIREIYPRYYPKGVVDFFLDLHNRDRIEETMKTEEIYLLKVDKIPVGTGGIHRNEINRLYILPEYQGRGYGTKLMDLLEEKIFCKYDTVCVDASFPAEDMYFKRGYRIISYKKIKTKTGDYLCYHIMEKYSETSV